MNEYSLHLVFDFGRVQGYDSQCVSFPPLILCTALSIFEIGARINIPLVLS